MWRAYACAQCVPWRAQRACAAPLPQGVAKARISARGQRGGDGRARRRKAGKRAVRVSLLRADACAQGVPVARSAGKDADMLEEEICGCIDCACVQCSCGGLERGCREDNLAHYSWFCILHFVLCLVADQELFCFCSA